MRVQRDDVCKTLQSTCFELPGELRHDVEAPGLGGSVESAGEMASDDDSTRRTWLSRGLSSIRCGSIVTADAKRYSVR